MFLEAALRACARIEHALVHRRSAQAGALLAIVVYGAINVSRGMGDYRVYHQAAMRLAAGEQIYQLSDPHRYLYAPVVTVAFLPLAIVPPVVGKWLWYAVNVVAVAALLRLSAVLVLPANRPPPGFLVLVFLLSFRFIDNNVGHGQANLLLLWLVLEAYALAGRGRPVLAGAALATAVATKIIPAIFLLQLLLRQQWRFLGFTLVALAILLALPVLWWWGHYVEVLRSWSAVLVDQAGHYETGNKINQSISSFVYRLFRPYPGGAPLVEIPAIVVSGISFAVHTAFVIPLAVVSARLARAGTPEPQGPGGEELSLYLLYSTVVSPISWKYYFANLMLPFATLSRRLWSDGRGGGPAGAALAVSFLLNLVPGTRLFGKQAGLWFQLASFHFLAVVVLFVAILASSASDARDPRSLPETSGSR